MNEYLSISELQASMQAGDKSSVSLCEAYLKRIAELDTSGPKLNAVIELNPDALSIAETLDNERKNGNLRGALHGVPIMLKDNIDTHDRMMTTAGSLALEGSIAAQDAFIVSRLRDAGAVILAKTNLSEWANFRSTRSSSGWSSRGGQTRNPYSLDRSPCGSSSGSGAAVAAGLCAAAIGTETDGSITCPAHINGLVGLKPTLGLVSRTGIIPIAHSQDTAGPMTRSVRDAALMLTALTGVDAKDPVTREQPSPIGYADALTKTDLQGVRLGVVRNLMGYHEAVDAVAENSYEQLKALGATLVDIEIETVKQLREHEFTVMLYEFRHNLNAYLAQLSPDFPRTLADVIAFNEANTERAMPFFKQELLEMAQAKGPLTEGEYRHALEQAKHLSQVEGIDKALQEHKLNALVAPTGAPAWTIDRVSGDRYLGSSSSLAAVAGYAHITVPSGFIHGLPVGLSFFAGAFSEQRLLQCAFAFEQATQMWQAPTFRKSIGEAA